MTRLKTLASLLATSAAVALAGAPAMAQDAAAETTATLENVDPALWVVEDEDTTIYLFGTFHAMKDGVEWFNDEVKTSYDASDEVVVELIAPEDPAQMQPLIMKYGINMSGEPLSAKLSEDARAALHETLEGMGAPAQAFDMFKPGFASVSLTAGLMPGWGFDPELGVDKSVITAAKADGKPITELETIEEQLIVLTATLSEEEQLRMLEESLLEIDDMDDQLETMLAAWKTGDEATFAELFGELNDSSEAFYDALLTNRNANWAKWIEERTVKPGSVFIAVGAGHLAGSDSVQAILAQHGLKAERVQ